MQFMTSLFGGSAGTLLNAAFALGIVLVLIVFGLWLLFDSALGLRWVALAVTGSVVVAVGALALVRAARRRSSAPTPSSTTPSSLNSP